MPLENATLGGSPERLVIKVHVGWFVVGSRAASRAGSAQALLSCTSIWGRSFLQQMCVFWGGFFFPLSPQQQRVSQHLRLNV